MYYYAVFNPVTHKVIAIDSIEYQMQGNDRVQIDEPDESLIGKIYDKETGTFVPDPEVSLSGDTSDDLPTVEVNLSKDTAIADGEDSVEISFVLKNDDGSIYDWSGEYKIILRNEDNSVIKPLLISINNGQGQFIVKSSTPRRIKILPQDIRTAVLSSEIVIDFVEPVTSSEVTL